MGRNVGFNAEETDDRTVSDVAFGSLRYRRIGGMATEIIGGSMADADRHIFCTDGSVMILVEFSGSQFDWNRTETSSSPGNCSNTFRR